MQLCSLVVQTHRTKKPLTQAQRDSIATGQTGSLDYLQYMTYSTPAYDMSVMGPFAVEKMDDVLTPEDLEELELGEKIYTPYPLVTQSMESGTVFYKDADLTLSITAE